VVKFVCVSHFMSVGYPHFIAHNVLILCVLLMQFWGYYDSNWIFLWRH